ncbi:MAG: tRNA (guanosine(37)-N1)-methyltransferase TrmD, partial [Cyclobacteriaceae bacterium]
MHIDIITCLPRLLESPFGDSILKRAQEKNLVIIKVHDLREYSTHKHRATD